MSTKINQKSNSRQHEKKGLNFSAIDSLLAEPTPTGFVGFIKVHWVKGAVGACVLLLTIGVFAKNGWFPRTDNLTGKKTGWFGAELPKNAPSSWNPFAVPPPPSTPQLAKEYVYAGSRLLSVEDKNASAAPPTDLAFWRPSTGGWHIYNSDNLGEDPTVVFGEESDIPILGDYDGDGRSDFAYYRPDENGGNNEWHIQRSSDGTEYTVGFSFVGLDAPVAGDFDGDGKTDLAAWKSVGTSHPWTIQYSSTGAVISTSSFGSTGDKPFPADYDGDGKADLAVWHGATLTFTWKSSINGQVANVPFTSPAASGDKPVCADYDGNGMANFALQHGASWIIMSDELVATTTTPWSGVTGTPVQNDYDGDGKVDIAVWYLHAPTLNAVPMGYWKILESSSNNQNTRTEQFGMNGDIPVPAYYRRH